MAVGNYSKKSKKMQISNMRENFAPDFDYFHIFSLILGCSQHFVDKRHPNAESWDRKKVKNRKKSPKKSKELGSRTGDLTPNDGRYGKMNSGIGISIKF